MSNADLWKTVTEHLTSGATVRNWTAAKGYFGEDFVVKSIEPDHLVVAAPGAENEQHVPRKDFELVDKVWGGYWTPNPSTGTSHQVKCWRRSSC
jgi:hypothetical protein